MAIDEATQLDAWLYAAVSSGFLSSGQVQRLRLVTRLAGTLTRLCSLECPDTCPSEGRTAVSGETLGRDLRLSRAAVHKHVDQLRSLGFVITSAPGSGYRLEKSFADLVAAEAVLPYVLSGGVSAHRWRAGLPYFYLPRCESTNLALKELVIGRDEVGGRATGPSSKYSTSGRACLDDTFLSSTPRVRTLPAGALLVTDEQTGGRGRLGRRWSSQQGKDLTFSVLARPSLAPVQAHLLSLAAALAVAEVLETIPGLEGEVGIKWPNDVLLGEEKVCGILLEGSIDADRLNWAVAGIGLNVNSTPSVLMEILASDSGDIWAGRPRPTSLRERLSQEVPRAPLLAALLARLAERWTEVEDGASGVLAALRERDVLIGRRVQVYSGALQREALAEGEAVGIGSEGQLLVRLPSGITQSVFSGDVTLKTGL